MVQITPRLQTEAGRRLGRTIDHIQRVEGDAWETIYSLRVVLTVPAIWSPIAKEKTLRAAKTAGLPANIDLVSEPEAAALAVLKEKDKEKKLEVGSSFVVCDCGGGTVVSSPI